MMIRTWEEFTASPSATPLAVTIGVFDGLHTGHRALIDEVLRQEPAMESCVVTFVENPKKVLHRASFKGNIFSLEQKKESLSACGIKLCVLIDFSQDFGKHSGGEFLRLLFAAGVRFLCVGPNFKCGHNMDTGAAELPALCDRLGIRAKIVDPVMYKGYPVSSSRVRKAVIEGDLAEAREMLGRPYEVWLLPGEDGRRVSPRGRSFFCDDPSVVLPPDGEYRVGIREKGDLTMTEARILGGRLCVPVEVDSPVLRVAIFERVSKEA